MDKLRNVYPRPSENIIVYWLTREHCGDAISRGCGTTYTVQTLKSHAASDDPVRVKALQHQMTLSG